jgi:DNA-binding NarL/FixJ family response regulator
MVADGIRLLLGQSTSFQFAGKSNNASSTLQLIEQEHPYLLLLDLNLKGENGFVILEQLKKQFAQLKVIILTIYDDETLVEKARQLGADGFITKDTDSTELLHLLEEVASGSSFVEPAALRKRYQEHPLFRDQFVESMHLTKREVEMIQLITQGKHAPEIANELFLSLHTVNTHRKNILKKLNLSNVAELVRFAVENRLV